MTPPSGKLTLQNAASELNCSLEQVRRYVREGKLPVEKLGVQWFVERRNLKAFKGGVDNPPGEDILTRSRKWREEIKNNGRAVNVIELLD